jgi:hypothetical protein
MTRVAVSPAELRSALADLALRSAAFVRGRGMRPAREALLASITAANQALSAEDLPAEASAQAGASDAEALVCTTDGLRQMADAADAEARSRHDYRRDWEG